jgi:C_GCAxxG_C_C family probable redox protein
MDDTLIRMMQLGGQGFSCSQVIMIMGLQASGRENPDLVRSLSGLAYGCGTGRGVCGALTGAACLLGLYAGKGSSQEQESERLLLMLQELNDWFSRRIGLPDGSVSCDAIVGEEGPAASRRKCGTIVADTYAKTMELLLSNGFEPYGV